MGLSLFGGRSGGTNSSSTSNITETTNVSGGASEGSFNVSAGGDVSMVDPGAIDLAGAVTLGALDAMARTFEQNVSAMQKGFSSNVALTTEALNKTTLDSGERMESLLTKLGLIAAGVLVVVIIGRKFA